MFLRYQMLIACALSLLWATTALAAPEPMPTEGWIVNNWRKNDATATFKIVNAPDETPAIEAEFKGKPAPNVVSKDITELAQTWPDKYGSLSFDCYSDGSGQRVSIQLYSGKHKHIAMFNLSHTGWKHITIQSMWAPKGTPALAPNKVTRYAITAADSCKVAICALKFESPSVPMNLETGVLSYAVQTNQTPKIDGKLDEAMWDNSPWLATDHPLRGGSTEAGKAQFRLAYDNDNLYIAAKVRQDPGTRNLGPNFTGEGAQVWTDESVEIFVNPMQVSSTFYQMVVNRMNTTRQFVTHFNQIADMVIYDTQWDWSKLESATINGEEQWTTEIKVPWTTIGAKGPTNQINLQLMHNDWQNIGDGQVIHTVWAPASPKPMSLWGAVNLLEKPVGKRSPIQVTDLKFDRVDLGKYRLTVQIKRDDKSTEPLGNLRVNVTLAGPSRQFETWQREINAKQTATTFTSEFVAETYSSGLHQVAVHVTSDDPASTVPGGAIAQFVQEIPVNVAYGEMVLTPKPKQMTQSKGHFILASNDQISLTSNATDRTNKTAKLLAQRLYGHFGLTPELVQNISKARIQMSIQPDVVRAATNQKNIEEAYLLNVTSEGIELIGGGEAGLYYAVVTLNQLARVPHEPKSPIGATEIVDWPSTDQRIYSERFTTNMRRVEETPNFERYKKTLEKLVLGGKFNVLIFTIDRNFAYQKNPALTVHPTVNAKQLRELADWANEHFIEFIPATIYGSHAQWVTMSGLSDMIEPGYNKDQLDVTSPKFIPLMQDIVGELLEAAGPQTKRFMIFNDEWWHKQTKSPEVIYKGMTRQELFTKAIMAEYDFLKSRGVQMMMYTDMIDPTHNGGAPFHLSKVAEKLPRDIIMCSWSGSPRIFKDMGFEVLKINNNFTLPPRDLAEYVDGFGTLVYWLEHSTFNYVTNSYSAIYSWHSTMRAADYAWNIGVDSNLSRDEWARRVIPNLMPTLGLDDVPLAGKVISLPMPGDTALGSTLGLSGTHKIGGIEMSLSPVVVTRDAVKVQLPSPTLTASAILLQGVRFPSPEAREEIRKDTLHRVFAAVHVGDVVFHYEDGSTAQIDLRLGVNTIETGAAPLNQHVLNNGKDRFEFGDNEALLQSEWLNPHPDRKVVAIAMVSARDASPFLWAGLTIREVAR